MFDTTISPGSDLTLMDLNICLEQVNKIRKALAIGEGTLKELPQGIPGDNHECVLARALSNGWGAAVSDELLLRPPREINFSVDDAVLALRRRGFEAEKSRLDNIVMVLTTEMNKVINAFDRESLPDLIVPQDEDEF